MIWRLAIWRLRIICGAYLAACAASGFVVALELLSWFLIHVFVKGGSPVNARPFQDTRDVADVAYFLLQVTGGASAFAVVYSFIPAVIVIAITEARGLRSVALYGGTGLVTAVVASRLFLGGPQFLLSMPTSSAGAMPILLAGVAGLAGGLVYWRIAGRTAGIETASHAPSSPHT